MKTQYIEMNYIMVTYNGISEFYDSKFYTLEGAKRSFANQHHLFYNINK